MTNKSDVLLQIAQFENVYDIDNDEQNKSIALNIYDQIDRFVDGTEPTAEEVAKVTVAMNKHIQVRDFVLGLPKERDIQFVGSWAAFVGKSTPTEYAAPIATIISSLYYSVGDKEEATRYLGLAYASDPTYSLAKLLDRVYQAGWESTGFESMRNELHDQVKENLGI
jgi:hypothetical protein